MNKKEYDRIAKIFIIGEKRDLPIEIAEILIVRDVRTIKGGNPILLGEFDILPKKKRERVHDIALKLYNFFIDKENLFNMSDIIDLTNIDRLLDKKQDALSTKGEIQGGKNK